MKCNSNYPEENVVKLILPKYFTDSIHTTNVITLFAIDTYLHVVYETPDKTHNVRQTMHLL